MQDFYVELVVMKLKEDKNRKCMYIETVKKT